MHRRAGRRSVPAARTLPPGPVPPAGATAAAGPIAPVIPSATLPARGRHGAGRPSRVACPLPLASSPPGSAQAAGDVIYGIGRIDASGRVASRMVTGVLGWRGGDRLTLTAGQDPTSRQSSTNST